jgi:hypothetical protein
MAGPSPDAGSPRAERLAEDLRGSLRRRRFRPAWIVGGVLTLGILILGAVAWSIYHDSGAHPILQVVALDSVANLDERSQARAVLLRPLPDGSAAGAGGWELIFQQFQPAARPDAGPRLMKAVTDRRGYAEVNWEVPKGETSAEFVARFVDTRRRQGTTDPARVFGWPKDTALVVVEVEDVLAELPREPLPPTTVFAPEFLAGAAAALHAVRKDVHVVYLTPTVTSWLQARRVRNWITHRATFPESIPLGPVLGRADFPAAAAAPAVRQEAIEMLRAHFAGTIVAIVRDAAPASAYEKLGVRVIVVGAEAPGGDLLHAPAWADVPDLIRGAVAKK